MTSSKVFLAIFFTLFLAKTSNATSIITAAEVTIACNLDAIVVTITGTPFSSNAASVDATCTPVGGTNLITGTGPYVISLLATHTSCWTATNSFAGGAISGDSTVTVKDINFKVNPLFDDKDDIKLQIQCAYSVSELTKKVSGTSSFSVDTVDKTSEIMAIALTTGQVTLKFHKASDGSEITTGTAVDINAETSKICVVAKATGVDANVADLNLKTVTFSKASAGSTGDDTSDYIVNYCPTSAASVSSFMQDTTAHTGGACGAAATDAVTNCDLQRALCFKPFAFTSTTSLFVAVVIVPSTTSGLASASSCTPNTVNAIGRKRRETDLDEVQLSAMLSLMRGAAGEMQSCKITEYMITAVVCATGFVLSTIAAVFAFCLNNQARIKPFA